MEATHEIDWFNPHKTPRGERIKVQRLRCRVLARTIELVPPGGARFYRATGNPVGLSRVMHGMVDIDTLRPLAQNPVTTP